MPLKGKTDGVAVNSARVSPRLAPQPLEALPHPA
jgi:hypothetical protein